MELRRMSRAQRERLINVALFIAQEADDLVAKKLFKLIYAMDVVHFQTVGRTLTGLDYYAAQPSPVPSDLAIELEAPRPDLAAKISAKSIYVAGKRRDEISPAPGAVFSDDRLAPAQMSIVRDVIAKFGKLPFDQIDLSTVDHGAFEAAWAAPASSRRWIDMTDTIPGSDPERGNKLAIASEHQRRDKFIREVA
jgi:hypothetical protein